MLIFAERLSNIRTEKCPRAFGSMNFIESKWNLFLKKCEEIRKIFKNLLGTFISEQLHGVILTMLPARKLKHRNSLTGQPVWASRQTDGQTDRATERVDIPSGKFP